MNRPRATPRCYGERRELPGTRGRLKRRDCTAFGNPSRMTGTLAKAAKLLRGAKARTVWTGYDAMALRMRRGLAMAG